MKARNDFAKTVASAIALQLFALAVDFCMYAIIAGGVFYSLSEQTGKIICISLAAAITIGLCVFNVAGCISRKKVYITRPDSISLRDGEESVRLAYATARPVLIYKITLAMVALTVSGLVYIIISIIMEDKALAGIYGRIVCCLIGAICVIVAYPCMDRISCYRALLGETSELIVDEKPGNAPMYIAAFAVPVSICVWYVWRYYLDRSDIAWIVLPVVALFAMAAAFLAGWTDRKKDGLQT